MIIKVDVLVEEIAIFDLGCFILLLQGCKKKYCPQVRENVLDMMAFEWQHQHLPDFQLRLKHWLSSSVAGPADLKMHATCQFFIITSIDSK